MTDITSGPYCLPVRELPANAGFTVPHVQCARAVKYFLSLLEAEYAELQSRIAASGPDLYPPIEILADLSLEFQALSQSVQIFAGMAIESATNLYGVLALGESHFYDALERKPLLRKLKQILKSTAEMPQEGDAELISIASRVAERRNEFVHPKPQEIHVCGPRSGRAYAPADLAAARQASEHMQRFLGLLSARHYRYRMFFHVF